MAVRHNVGQLLSRQPHPHLQALLSVVKHSAQPFNELHLIGQHAHQAAIADQQYAPFNTDQNGSAMRNVHASGWFFHWHRGQLLALEQAARRSVDISVPSDFGVPLWNITAPDAHEQAASLLALYAPARSLRLRWTYKGPPEAELVEASLPELVGARLITALHSAPHEWFRLSGAQPEHTTNLDNPLFLPLHAYLDVLFDRWLERHSGAPSRTPTEMADGDAMARPASSTLHGPGQGSVPLLPPRLHAGCADRVVEPEGLVCGVRCSGGADGQRQLRERVVSDCLQFLPLWGFTFAHACAPLSSWGVHYPGARSGGGGGGGGGSKSTTRAATQHEPELIAPATVAIDRWLAPRPAREVIANLVTLARNSPHLPAGLRMAWLSPLRRETILLIPNGCGARAPAAPVLVGRLPAQLLLPTAVAAGSSSSAAAGGSGWRCADHGSGAVKKRVLLRLAWEVRGTEAHLTVDSRISQAGRGGVGCELAGTALLCATLCPSLDHVTSHATLRHPSGFNLSGAACLHVERSAGAMPMVLPLGRSVSL